MSNPIFIARQDTLDEKIIPAQLLNDYKLHGEYSFVFHTPELWHKMCTHAYAANDQKVNGDALEYVLTKAAPTGSYSLSNWMALLCDTAEQAAQGLYAGIETAGQLAQSSAAMAAVSNSETAMAAVSGSEMAMNSICSVKTALRAFAASKHWDSTVKENDMAIAKAAVALANSNEFSTISSCAEMVENSTAMSVLAASETAMSVLADSATARKALTGSSYYGKYMQNNTMCIAKLVVGFANLASAGYSSMAGVAADATAMNAVAASSTAMNAVAASTTALDALYARKKRMSGGSASKTGKFIILEISASNAFNTSKYGYATLSDGSKPDWGSYVAKYAFFKKYPKYATYMKNDTDSDDYIDYFDITNP
nr:MAG TPA: Tail fiber protein [Caudoviricetes sp.]